jgi:hypothetical protein
MELLPSHFLPVVYVRNPDNKKEYLFDLWTGSERVIPKDRLTLIGNIQGDDLFPFKGHGYYNGYAGAEWKNFERKIIDQYLAWEGYP